MKISIIITTCKRDISVLNRAVSSALNQTYSDKEIIIINDFPANRNIIDEALKNYNVSVFHNEKNLGACVSRNLGADHAVGEYIAFMDDDDEWIPTKLEKQAVFAKNGADFVYCNGTGVYENGYTIPLNGIEKIHGNALDLILAGNCFGGSSFPLIRKDVFYAVGGFDPEFESSQDHDLWIRIAEKYKIAFCEDPLVIYHIGKESISGNPEKRIQGYDKMLEKYSSIFPCHRDAAVKLLYSYFKSSLERAMFKPACRYAAMSFKFFPLNLKFFCYFCASLSRAFKKKLRK